MSAVLLDALRKIRDKFPHDKRCASGRTRLSGFERNPSCDCYVGIANDAIRKFESENEEV